jgi:hypothetical protein
MTTTLADRVIEAVADRRTDRFTRELLLPAAKDIQTAQRFVMTEDVRDAVRDLLTSRPSSLLSALSYARPPFERCWIEWPTPNQPEPKHAIRIRTKRVGAMITAEPDSNCKAFKFYTVWNYDVGGSFERWLEVTKDRDIAADIAAHHKVGIGVSVLQVGFDFTALDGSNEDRYFKGWHAPPGSKTWTREHLASIRDDQHNAIRFVLADPKERESLEKIESLIRWGVRRGGVTTEHLAASASFGKAGIEAALDDVRDEIGPLISMLVLMNSKNCVDVSKGIVASKHNKARVKSGKPAFLDHSTVHIKLGKTNANIAAAHGMTHEEARRHLVRGHFKIRKYGVYWWTPHLRGNALRGHIDRDSYIIDPAHK